MGGDHALGAVSGHETLQPCRGLADDARMEVTLGLVDDVAVLDVVGARGQRTHRAEKASARVLREGTAQEVPERSLDRGAPVAGGVPGGAEGACGDQDGELQPDLEAPCCLIELEPPEM